MTSRERFQATLNHRRINRIIHDRMEWKNMLAIFRALKESASGGET